MDTQFQTVGPTESAAAQRAEKQKRLRVCSTCHRAFKRTEHCLRHERAHKRERPFSCRFCERAYGRKDLLVRHEKTLHAEAWTKAQEGIKAAANRPVRRRGGTGSWFRDALQKSSVPGPVAPSLDEQHMAESAAASARSTRFFPSPRVPYTMECSDHEPGNPSAGESHFDLNFPLTPRMPDAMDIIPGRTEIQDIHESYSFDQHRAIYGFRAQIDLSDSFSSDASTPVDPNLSTTLPGTDALPLSEPKAEIEALDFLSLLPDSELNQASFSNYITGLESQSSSPIALNKTAAQIQWFSSGHDEEHGTSDRHVASKDRMLRLREPLVRLPRLIKERKYNLPPVTLDRLERAALLADLGQRICVQDQRMDIPSSQTLQRFIKQFFNCFNSHLPIFHIPSFDVKKAPSPLILAMCSIGALYHLERRMAVHLRELANKALSKTFLKRSDQNSAVPRPLWEVQCKLLLIVGAAFGGDSAAVSAALEDIGFFHREYSLRRASLSPNATGHECSTWAEWIDRESSKRLLYGIFIVSSLLTITYNLSPCFSTTHDLDLEMPEEERLWTASNEEQWQEAMMSRTLVTRLKINQALTQLIFGKEFDLGKETRWPAFATSILMHAVNVHMWHVTQCTQSFTNFSVDLKMEEQMKMLCTAQIEAALTRCHRVLTLDRSSESGHTWDEAEGPLVFNGLALLRSCYVRAFTGSGTFNRTMLFNDRDVDVESAARDYAQSPLIRTPFLTKAVAQVFAGLLTPIRAGHLLVRKTAAFSWSIEHAIAAWDCALFYTKWVHTMEIQQHHSPPDPEEKESLDNVKELLRKVDSEHSENASLAAEVTQAWATFLDDVWVWEVTWRMGKLLRRLADVYEEDWRVHQDLA